MQSERWEKGLEHCLFQHPVAELKKHDQANFLTRQYTGTYLFYTAYSNHVNFPNSIFFCNTAAPR